MGLQLKETKQNSYEKPWQLWTPLGKIKKKCYSNNIIIFDKNCNGITPRDHYLKNQYRIVKTKLMVNNIPISTIRSRDVMLRVDKAIEQCSKKVVIRINDSQIGFIWLNRQYSKWLIR